MAKKQYGDQNGRNPSPGQSSQGGRFKQRAARNGVADWIAVDPVIIQQAIAAMARVDGALRFGYSRDGGAYAIGVYGDGDPYTEYFGPNDDVEGFLRDIAEHASGD